LRARIADLERETQDLSSKLDREKHGARLDPLTRTVSCGLTELRPGDAGGAAFDRADGALYRAKHSGKNACMAA
jgi:PleD family two-component response regulator